MSEQRREVTKRIKNRLMLSVAMFIACGMGLLVLLDSRHVGNMISRSEGQMGHSLIAYNQYFPGDSQPIVFTYTNYRSISFRNSTSEPTLVQIGRPAIEAYYQANLSRIYNSSFDFDDNFYYEIQYAMAIPDVDKCGVMDIFVSLGRVSNTDPFEVVNQGETYGGLKPNLLAYFNVLCSGKNGSIIHGTTLAEASFADSPVTSAAWVDYDFVAGNELTMRDTMPDLVCMFNASENYYLQAFHLDIYNTSPDPHLAWQRNNSEVFTGSSTPEEFRELIFINATQPNNTMVLATTWNKFIRFYACNGSFALYKDYDTIFLASSEYDFTGDGVDEVYRGSRYGSPIQFNMSVFDLRDNSTYAQDSESFDVDSSDVRDKVLVTRPNVTNQDGFPIAYFSINIGFYNNQPTYLACRMILTTGTLNLQKIFFGEDAVGVTNLDLGFFNGDNVYDLVVQRKGAVAEGQKNTDIIVYDGQSVINGEMKQIESQPAGTAYTSGAFHLIPDIGGNGKPDFLICNQGNFVVASFETIFFWQHNLILTVLFALCIVGFFAGTLILIQWRRALKKAAVNQTPEQLDDGTASNPVNKQGEVVKVKKSPLRKVIISIIILLIAISAPFIIMMRIQSAGEPLMSANVSMIHIFTAVLGVFYAMIPIIAVLYNITAPKYATSLYINAQAKFFTMQPGKHDYRVLVLDFGGRNKRSMVSYLSRCLFPIFLAVYLGNTVFSVMYNGPPLSGFTGDPAMLNWIMNFELFCSLPIVIGFGLASLLVPSSWLLDDAGVVYFLENLVLREPGDISKISEWLTKYIKAIAGFAAILSYFSLFQNVNFASLGESSENPFFVIVIFINVVFLLFAFPFIGGFLYMLIAQITIENNLPVLKQKLFQRMNAMGIDTTPRQLRDVLDPKDRAPRELEKVWKKVNLPHKGNRNGDAVAIRTPLQP